jgi:hypothetical protein
MSDEVEQGEQVDQVTAEALYSDDEMEVFLDGAGAPSTEQSKLIDELKARQAELQAQVNPVEAMKSAIAGLSQNLTPKPEAVDVSVRAGNGVQDWNAYKENFNSKIFEDPFQMVTDLVSKSAEMQSASVANQNLAYSKRIVQIDPATSTFYKRWPDEVEREVAKMPVSVRASNPNVYEDALRIVKANHLEELLDERMSTQAQQAKPAVARQPQYSESGNARVAAPAAVPQAARSQLRVSSAKMNEINAYAAEWGIPEEAAIRLFQKRGLL